MKIRVNLIIITFILTFKIYNIVPIHYSETVTSFTKNKLQK